MTGRPGGMRSLVFSPLSSRSDSPPGAPCNTLVVYMNLVRDARLIQTLLIKSPYPTETGGSQTMKKQSNGNASPKQARKHKCRICERLYDRGEKGLCSECAGMKDCLAAYLEGLKKVSKAAVDRIYAEVIKQ